MSELYALIGQMQFDVTLVRLAKGADLPRFRAHVHIAAFAAYPYDGGVVFVESPVIYRPREVSEK